MQFNLLSIQLFISVTFFVIGLFTYFVPRNSIIGMRLKYTIASDALWSKYNKISGVVMSGLGALMFVSAVNGRPIDDRFAIIIISIALIILVFFSKKDFEKAKANGEIDFDYDAQKASTQAPTSAPKKSGFVFSKENRVNVFFCLFCGFIIFIFYAWFRHVSSFMPEKIVSHINSAGIVDGAMLSKDLFLVLNTLFGVILFLAVLGSFIFSKFFKDKRQTPFSLKIAPICTSIAIATLCCGLIAIINYLVYAINLPRIDVKDFSLTVFLAYCAALGAFAILIAISNRNKRKPSEAKDKIKPSKKSKKRR